MQENMARDLEFKVFGVRVASAGFKDLYFIKPTEVITSTFRYNQFLWYY